MKRLQAEGRVYLLPELVNIVLEHLCPAITPRWLPQPKRRQLDRVHTGGLMFDTVRREELNCEAAEQVADDAAVVTRRSKLIFKSVPKKEDSEGSKN